MAIRRRKILIVGAGVQGLFCALEAIQSGFDVEVVSAGPDPRESEGEQRSATFGGEAGRFVTLFEGQPYLGSSPMYPEMHRAFSQTVTDGGWLGGLEGEIAEAERSWLDQRRLRAAHPDSLHALFGWYIATSLRSMQLWRGLFDTHAYLFESASLNRGPVLRLYNEPDMAESAAAAHAKFDVLRRLLSVEELHVLEPALSGACDSGVVRGGILVEGYCFNILTVIKHLIDHLEQAGVTLRWERSWRGVCVTASGELCGLRIDNTVEISDHYIIAPGAYCERSLLGELGVSIGGIAGCWILLPRPEGLTRPIKAHLTMPSVSSGYSSLTDLNFTPYWDESRRQEYLAIGGGYLHGGSFPFRYSLRELDALHAQVGRAVRSVMPEQFDRADRDGTLVRSEAICFRSFTPDDRPGVAIRKTDRGGRLVLHTGLNTGTTSMAPAIAQSIVAFLQTDEHHHVEGFGGALDRDSREGIPGYLT